MTFKTVICSSVKGGTGKTKTAAELARAFKRKGYRVGIADFDYQAPNMEAELGIGNPLDMDAVDRKIIPAVTEEGFQLVSFSSLHAPGEAVLVDESVAVRELSELQRPGEIAWDNRDFVIVDSAPSSSKSVQISLSAPNSLGTILVTQPSNAAREDLVRSFSLMRERRVPILGVVLNHAIYICPHCGYVSGKLYDIDTSEVEKLCMDWGIEVLARIPLGKKLDTYFDDLADKVLRAEPKTLKREKKKASEGWRLVQWLGKLSKTSTSK